MASNITHHHMLQFGMTIISALTLVIIAIVMEIADIIAVTMADKALNIHITRKGKIML